MSLTIPRPLLIALLAIGTVGGYAAGFASLHHRAAWRRHHFERHVSELCADAALRSRASAPHAQ
jgi:hypothetical protein